MVRLRKAVNLYHWNEGRGAEVVIAFEKGAYRPRFFYQDGKPRPKNETAVVATGPRSTESLSVEECETGELQIKLEDVQQIFLICEERVGGKSASTTDKGDAEKDGEKNVAKGKSLQTSGAVMFLTGAIGGLAWPVLAVGGAIIAAGMLVEEAGQKGSVTRDSASDEKKRLLDEEDQQKFL